MAHITLDHVDLTFRVRPLSRITLKEYLLREMFRRTPNSAMDIHALRDVCLEFHEGDRVAVIGCNGAGKSTLLKLIAGIYPQTGGSRHTAGKISSLFDLMLGIEGEASGWENIAYRGYLQGETPRSIRAKMKAVADFSELGRFLDVPVRHYSAGMVFRLAFSIATAIEPEILLLDEVFSVGDLGFQEKARERMRETVAKARLLVMVNHDLEHLTKVCNRAVWLDQGRVKQTGSMREVFADYTTWVHGRLQHAA